MGTSHDAQRWHLSMMAKGRRESFSHFAFLVLAFSLISTGSAGWLSGPSRPSDETPKITPLPGVSEDMLPLPYLGTTVAGALVSFDASEVRYYDDKDKDQIRVDLEGQGPTLWSLPRWNQGDCAPRLQPRRPYSQPSLGAIMEGYMGARFQQPQDIPTQAWRPSIQKGVVLATVAQNGQLWNDSAGLFYGTVACVYASHGFGYSMDTGEFGMMEHDIDIAVGKLGAMLEGNVDVGIVWFPYHQGWVAGYVDTPGEYSHSKAHVGWTLPWSFSPALPAEARQTVSWDELGALLSIPGVDARYDGMIFTTSTNPGPGNNDGNVVSSFIDGRSWRVQVREDGEANPEVLCDPKQAMFAFVYVPYTAGGLIGGHVDGSSGVPRVWRGNFVARRVKTGVYHVDITRPGLDFFKGAQPLSNRDGMLLLQSEGRDPQHPRFTQHAVLSYAILPNGTIEVQSHRLVQEAGRPEEYPAMVCNFYFAWVDFRTPLTPTQDEYLGRGGGGAAMEDLSFWDGFGAGVCLVLLGALLWGAVLLLSARVAQRSSILALAPLAEPVGEPDADLRAPATAVDAESAPQSVEQPLLQKAPGGGGGTEVKV